MSLARRNYAKGRGTLFRAEHGFVRLSDDVIYKTGPDQSVQFQVRRNPNQPLSNIATAILAMAMFTGASACTVVPNDGTYNVTSFCLYNENLSGPNTTLYAVLDIKTSMGNVTGFLNSLRNIIPVCSYTLDYYDIGADCRLSTAVKCLQESLEIAGKTIATLSGLGGALTNSSVQCFLNTIRDFANQPLPKTDTKGLSTRNMILIISGSILATVLVLAIAIKLARKNCCKNDADVDDEVRPLVNP